MLKIIMNKKEETLDPENWNEMEKLGLQMVSDMMHNLATVRERKVWQPPTPEVKKYFQQQPPSEGEAPEKVYEAVESDRVDLGLVSYPVATKEIAVVPWRKFGFCARLDPPGSRF